MTALRVALLCTVALPALREPLRARRARDLSGSPLSEVRPLTAEDKDEHEREEQEEQEEREEQEEDDEKLLANEPGRR